MNEILEFPKNHPAYTTYEKCAKGNIACNKIHDRLNLYFQMSMFHRGEIEQLKEQFEKKSSMDVDRNKEVLGRIENMRKDFQEEMKTSHKRITNIVVGTQKWAISILISMILGSGAILLTIILNGG